MFSAKFIIGGRRKAIHLQTNQIMSINVQKILVVDFFLFAELYHTIEQTMPCF